MMRHAELLGLQPPGSNPCKGLRRRKTSFKATYLSEAQWARLGAALRRLEETHPREAGCFRFLALTGCRKGEALALRWDMLARRRIQLSDWQGQSYILRNLTGRQAIVSNVTEVWAALEAEFGGGFDPLDPANFPETHPEAGALS